MQEPSVRRRSYESGSSSPLRWNRSTQHLDRFWLMTMAKMKVGCCRGGLRERQPPASRNIQHLDGNRKSEGAGHPTLCSTNPIEDSIPTTWAETRARKAMKEHGIGNQHLAWISKLWEQHSLDMRLRHFTSRKFKTTNWRPQRAPESPLVFKNLVDTVLSELNKTCW